MSRLIKPGSSLNQLSSSVDIRTLNPGTLRPKVYDLGFKLKSGSTDNNQEIDPVCSKQIKVEPYFVVPSTSPSSQTTTASSSGSTGNEVRIDLITGSTYLERDKLLTCSKVANVMRCPLYVTDIPVDKQAEPSKYNIKNTDPNWKITEVVVYRFGPDTTFDMTPYCRINFPDRNNCNDASVTGGNSNIARVGIVVEVQNAP